MKKVIIVIVFSVCIIGCKNPQQSEIETRPNVVEQDEIINTSKFKRYNIEELKNKGFQCFNYVDEETKDTIVMQQYFIAFLKKGPIRNQDENEAASLQKAHLAHLKKMYDLGYADISGPFGDDGDIRGITIYNVPTIEMADSLANSDPMVKAGRLAIEIHPWWAGKGLPLR